MVTPVSSRPTTIPSYFRSFTARLATTMTPQEAEAALKRMQVGRYPNLPASPLTGEAYQKAAHNAYLSYAVRDIMSGTPVAQALLRIPEFQAAFTQGKLPLEKLAMAQSLLEKYANREMNQSSLFNQLRTLATTSSSSLGHMSESVELPSATRDQRLAQIIEREPQIANFYMQTAKNSGSDAAALRNAFPISDEQHQAIASASTTRMVNAGAGTGKTDTLVWMITDAIVNRGVDPQSFTALVATHAAEGELVSRLKKMGTYIPKMNIDWDGKVRTFHSKAMSDLNQKLANGKTALQMLGKGDYTSLGSSSSSKKAPRNAEEAFKAQTREEVKYFQNLLTQHNVRVKQSEQIFHQIQSVKSEHGYSGPYADLGRQGAQDWAANKKDTFPALLYLYEKARMGDPNFKQHGQSGPKYDLSDSLILAAKAAQKGYTKQPWGNIAVDEFQDLSAQQLQMLAASTRADAHRLFAGDPSQKTIKGGYRADLALPQMLPGITQHRLTGNYRMGPMNTAFYNSIMQQSVLDSRGRAPQQISMRTGGIEAPPTHFVGRDFKAVNERMFHDFLSQQGMSLAHVGSNIQAGRHPLQGAQNASGSPFVFQMDMQRSHFLTTIQHLLEQKVGKARARAALSSLFTQATPNGQGGQSAYALLVDQVRSRAFPHVFADVTRVGSKWDDAAYAEQMGVIASRPTVQLHAYASQTNIAGSAYDLSSDILHGQSVPPNFATYHQWMLQNATRFQGVSPSSFSRADQALLASPTMSRQPSKGTDLSAYRRFTDSMIGLVPHYRPAVGAGSGLIHTADQAGVQYTNDETGESTLAEGMSTRGRKMQALSAALMNGRKDAAPDMVKMDLMVAYARNMMEQGNAMLATQFWRNGVGSERPDKPGRHTPIDGSSFGDMSVDDLVNNPYLSMTQKEKALATQHVREFAPAETASDDWEGLSYIAHSQQMGQDREHFSYQGRDQQTLTKHLKSFLGSDLVRQHPRIKSLLEGVYSREQVEILAKDAKAPNVYDRMHSMRDDVQVKPGRNGNPNVSVYLHNAPILESMYKYAEENADGRLFDQMTQAVNKNVPIDQLIGFHVNYSQDDMLRDAILDKATQVLTSGNVSPDVLQGIRDAAEDFDFPALVRMIDTYSMTGDFLHGDEYGLSFNQKNMDDLAIRHPQEHALLVKMLGSTEGHPNLQDPQVQGRIAKIATGPGSLARMISSMQEGNRLGISQAQSDVSPFTTGLSALAQNLEIGGILDPDAQQMRSQVSLLSPVTSGSAEEEALGLQFQSEGAGVGMEGFQRRREDMLHLHEGGRIALSPEQQARYTSELEQVKALRARVHDPLFQSRGGHYLNMVHRAVTGQAATDKRIKKDYQQSYRQFLSPLNNMFREGGRTLSGMQDLVSGIMGGAEHTRRTGNLRRFDVDQTLAAMGHDPNSEALGTLRYLEGEQGFTQGAEISLSNLARQFPSEEDKLFRQLTREPFSEGMKVAYMGGATGYADPSTAHQGLGLKAGMSGTLRAYPGTPFGFSKDLGTYRGKWDRKNQTWERPQYLTPGESKTIPYEAKMNTPMPPLFMLERGGKQYPVRADQIASLQGSLGGPRHTATRPTFTPPTKQSVPVGKRNLLTSRPPSPAPRPQGFVMVEGKRVPWAQAKQMRLGGRFQATGTGKYATPRPFLEPSQEFLPPGTLSGSLGAASPFRTGHLVPDAMVPPPLRRSTAGTLAGLGKWLRSGSPDNSIPSPSAEQLAFMLDPTKRQVLEGGPGTGKTATAVRRLMHGVSEGAILPKNVLAASALKSAAGRIGEEFGRYQPLLPQGAEYRFGDPRTFSSIAASTVLQSWQDENGKDFYPMLQKLGYGHLTGEVLADPTAEELYGKDPDVSARLHAKGQQAFLTEQVNAFLTGRGKMPYSAQSISDMQKFIGEVKKSRGSPDSTYPHNMEKGALDLAAGHMTHPAGLALYEQGMAKKGLTDWDDLLHMAVEAYQKFGPDALPDVFKSIEAILVDEGQDVTPTMAALQKGFLGALKQNDPQVTVAMDVMQSLTQGMGGIPMGQIRGTMRDILDMPSTQNFHQLTQNFRSDAGTVAIHDSILSSPYLAGDPRSPVQVARSGNVGSAPRFITTKTQPAEYQRLFASMLSSTGLSGKQITTNIATGDHPFLGATTLPRQIGMIVPRNQDIDLFQHVARQHLIQNMGLSPKDATKAIHQMMRQGTIPPSVKPGSDEYAAAQQQMQLVKFGGSRGHEYRNLHMDASLTGMWQRNNDAAGHIRNLNVGLTRASQGGQTTVGASLYPFTRDENKKYIAGNLDLSDPDVMANLSRKSRKNEFETFEGRQVPRFFRDILSGGHAQLRAWGMQPPLTPSSGPSDHLANGEGLASKPKIEKLNVDADQVNISSKGAPKFTAPGPQPFSPGKSDSTFNYVPPLGKTVDGSVAPGGSVNMGAAPGPGSRVKGGGLTASGRGSGGNNTATGKSSFNNEEGAAGHSLARLGGELQFIGQYLTTIVDSAVKEGSAYRRATVALPGSGSGDQSGTSGFYDFTNASSGIAAFQQGALPMYSMTQAAQGIRSFYNTTGYQGTQPPTGTMTDIMGLAATTGMDPSQLISSMAGIAGATGQGQNLGSYHQMTGMLTNLFGSNLGQENVQPTLSALGSIVPTLAGVSGSSGATGQAMSFFQLAQRSGMTSQNFGDVSSLLGGLSQVGTAPSAGQAYTLQRLGYNVTASPGLAQIQSEQTSRSQQIAQLQLQQNINGQGLSLPMLQIQTDKAEIKMDSAQLSMDSANLQMSQAQLTMSGLQLQASQVGQRGAVLQQQYGVASYGFNLAMQNALYGPIGGDYSKLSGYSFQANQLQAQRNFLSPEVGVMFSPQHVQGLKNQEFYAGLQNQQQSLILGRSPLLSDALFQQQMKYIAEQASFYKQELALQNQQRYFDMVWQKRLLDQQAAQVAAQGKIVDYSAHILDVQRTVVAQQGNILGVAYQQFALTKLQKAYDEKSAMIQQKYLSQQVADLQNINAAINQQLGGQGPVSGKNLSPMDLVQRLANQMKSGALNAASLQTVLRGLGLSPQDMGTMTRLVTQLSKQPQTLQQMAKDMGNATDRAFINNFNKLKNSGAFNDQIQAAGTANAYLQLGGTGANWGALSRNIQIIASAESTIAKVLAPDTPFLQNVGTIANLLGPLVMVMASVYNAMSLIKGFMGGGGGIGSLLGKGTGTGVSTGTGGGFGGLGAILGGIELMAGWQTASKPGTLPPWWHFLAPGAMIGGGLNQAYQGVTNPRGTAQSLHQTGQSVLDWLKSLVGNHPLSTDTVLSSRYTSSSNQKSDQALSYLKSMEATGKLTVNSLAQAQKQQQDIYQKYTGTIRDTANVHGQVAHTDAHLANDQRLLLLRGQSQQLTSAKNRESYQYKASTVQTPASLNNQEKQLLLSKNSDSTFTRISSSQLPNAINNQATQIGQAKIANLVYSSTRDYNKDIDKNTLQISKNTAFQVGQGAQAGGGAGEPVSTGISHGGFETPHVNADFHAKMWYGLHQGVDFQANQGTPLREFAGGKVVGAGFMPWGGEVDVKNALGLIERYLHLSQINVSVGQPVKQGQSIGLTGGGTPQSGFGYWSHGAHSHVQVDQGDINHALNPWQVWGAMGLKNLSQFYGAAGSAGQGAGAGGGGMRHLHDGGIAMRRIVSEIGDGNEPEAVIPLSKLGQMLHMQSGAIGAAVGSSVSSAVGGSKANVSFSKVADKIEVHVHTTSSTLDDRAKDELMSEVFDILVEAVNKVNK